MSGREGGREGGGRGFHEQRGDYKLNF